MPEQLMKKTVKKIAPLESMPMAPMPHKMMKKVVPPAPRAMRNPDRLPSAYDLPEKMGVGKKK